MRSHWSATFTALAMMAAATKPKAAISVARDRISGIDAWNGEKEANNEDDDED